MKTKILVGLLVLIIIASCSSKMKTESAVQTIKKTFQLTDKDKVEILGIAEESKDVRLVKFKVNEKQSAAKMRKYDQGWQLDEVQNEFGIWTPVSAVTKKEEDELAMQERKIITQWAEIENVYNRRADIVQNLLDAVGGAANVREAYTPVNEALLKVKQLQSDEKLANNPEAFSKYDQAQADLSSALMQFIDLVEEQPSLKSLEKYRDLRSQLEGTENRITVARMRYNTAAQEFNSMRLNSIPGKSLSDKPYFKAGKLQQKVKF